ncbi:MAG: hypothetical protein HQ510_09885 [Candidatus Marinimicrobia bacterium]|nr:hypothetical protein [Candidatus Neomarinimicrobiota bacterium]
MKIRITHFIAVCMYLSILAGEGIQPYIFIGESGKTVDATSSQLVQSLFFSDDLFEVIGQYTPMDNLEKKVLVVTNPTLLGILERSNPSAGYLGGIRIGITRKGEMTYVSCQNPEYWAIAFLQDEYERERAAIAQFTKELKRSIPRFRMRIDLEFGSTQNFTEENINKYRYKSRSPHFEDALIVGEFDSFSDALSSIEKNIDNSPHESLVFSTTVIEGRVQLIGIQLAQESEIFLLLDNADRKHTACLPYELLIVENEVFILDPKYRLAISFPDMKSKMFSKVKSISKKIESAFKAMMKE